MAGMAVQQADWADWTRVVQAARGADTAAGGARVGPLDELGLADGLAETVAVARAMAPTAGKRGVAGMETSPTVPS